MWPYRTQLNPSLYIVVWLDCTYLATSFVSGNPLKQVVSFSKWQTKNSRIWIQLAKGGATGHPLESIMHYLIMLSLKLSHGKFGWATLYTAYWFWIWIIVSQWVNSSSKLNIPSTSAYSSLIMSDMSFVKALDSAPAAICRLTTSTSRTLKLRALIISQSNQAAWCALYTTFCYPNIDY